MAWTWNINKHELSFCMNQNMFASDSPHIDFNWVWRSLDWWIASGLGKDQIKLPKTDTDMVQKVGFVKFVMLQ